MVVAALFLYVPAWLLHRRGEDTADHGLTIRPFGRNLRVAVLVSAIVFPPYAVGFHVWQTQVFSGSLAPSSDGYLRFDAEWEGRPQHEPDADTVQVYVDHDRLGIAWGKGPTGKPSDRAATLRTDGRIRPLQGQLYKKGEGQWAIQPHGPSRRATVRIEGGSRLSIALHRDGQPIEPSAVQLGAGGGVPTSMPLESSRSLSWLIWLVLTQLLLVAIPEEFFYRGYLQSALKARWPDRWRFLGGSFGTSTVLTSALFATGHFVVGFDPQRLAVFFPSLLFGWMYNATGSIGGAVLFHALCNIVVDVMSKAYLF